jgi:NADP-reducing hydrogenase subunit HndB
MEKLTLADLRKFRDQKRQELDRRDPTTKDSQIIVAMGTCGIAAGAKATFGAILDELEKRKLGTVLVRQVGCMGLCHSEPNVEVVVPGMPTVIYGKVDEALGRRIVTEHVAEKKLIDSAICDRPAVDIVR